MSPDGGVAADLGDMAALHENFGALASTGGKTETVGQYTKANAHLTVGELAERDAQLTVAEVAQPTQRTTKGDNR